MSKGGLYLLRGGEMLQKLMGTCFADDIGSFPFLFSDCIRECVALVVLEENIAAGIKAFNRSIYTEKAVMVSGISDPVQVYRSRCGTWRCERLMLIRKK